MMPPVSDLLHASCGVLTATLTCGSITGLYGQIETGETVNSDRTNSEMAQIDAREDLSRLTGLREDWEAWRIAGPEMLETGKELSS